MKELEAYLDKAISGIPNAREAEEARMELEDHILTKAEIMCLSGMNERDAVLAVLAQMGVCGELKEDLAQVHAISFRKSRIIYEEETWQCKRLAKKLSKEIGMPYNALSEAPELLDEEVLVLIKKGMYQGKSSMKFMQYIKHLDKKQVKMAICINLVFMMGRTHGLSMAYYGTKHNLWHDQTDYYNYKRLSPFAVMLSAKGIDMVEEKNCFRDPFFFGWVMGMEVCHIISYLKRALVKNKKFL